MPKTIAEDCPVEEELDEGPEEALLISAIADATGEAIAPRRFPAGPGIREAPPTPAAVKAASRTLGLRVVPNVPGGLSLRLRRELAVLTKASLRSTHGEQTLRYYN